MRCAVVYSPHYDLSLLGFEDLHPFDTRKYSRAYNAAIKLVPDLLTIPTGEPITDAELAMVHTEAYLASLKNPAVLARALELPPIAMLPYKVIERTLLQSMRLAVRGTIQATEAALECGRAVNLAGGYHHAGPDRGEGFCLFADVALAVAMLRASGTLSADDRVLYIDLDVHQGNGVARCFADDPRIVLLDLYNPTIYPFDSVAKSRVNYGAPVPPGTNDSGYLPLLQNALDTVFADTPSFALAIYNAGTDVYFGDALGGLLLTVDGVLARDRLVFETLQAQNLPTVMVPSGGYSSASYRMIARTLGWLAGA